MPRCIALSLLTATLLLLTACGAETHESVGVETIKALENYADVLADVKDTESARTAGPKIEKVAQQMNDLNARRDALGEPPSSFQDEFMAEHGPRMEAALEAMARETRRIEGLDPAVLAELETAMRAIIEANRPR